MSVADVLGYLNSKGLYLKQAGANEVHMACFFCGEDPGARGRLYVNVDPVADIPGLFTCHLCGQSGNLITLKKHFGDSTSQADTDVNSRYEIFQAAARHFHRNLSDYTEALMYLKGPERGLTIETIVSHKLGYAGAEAPVYRALRDEGFSRKDILSTGLCYEKDGRVVECFNDMITIPYMTAGNVITIRGRTWPYDKSDKKPKYKTIPGADSRLFNSDFTWHEKEITLVEGEFDAMVLEQLGFPAVGVPGANAWQDQWDAYLADVRRIFVVFDRDAAGTRGAEKLEERFGSKIRPVHISPPGQKIDPTDWVASGHTAQDFQTLIDEANKTGGVLVTVDEAYEEFTTVDDTPGLKFGFDLLDAALYPGLRPSQLMVVLAKTGTGKALRNDQKVATVDGWKVIADLKVGDFVFGSKGIPTKVVGVFPQGLREMYSVKFSDGAEVVCDLEHLWQYQTTFDRLNSRSWRVGSLSEILKFKNLNRIHIPVCDPVEYPQSDLPLDSYTLGVLIGDGSFRGLTPTVSSVDPEILQKLQLLGCHLKHLGRCDYRITHGLNDGTRNPITSVLKDLQLWGKLSPDKDIPSVYMTASKSDRLSLLKGLMDTDGTIDKNGSCEFSSSSKKLACQVAELVRSLGGVTGWNGRGVREKSTTHLPCYRVTIRLPVCPFSLPRKVKKWKRPPSITRTIRSVTAVGCSEATCIKVASEDELFLTEDYIVTHNTLMLLNLMQRMALQKGQEDVKFLFLSLEQTRSEWFDRARRLHRFYNLNDTDKDAKEFWKPRLLMADRNRLTADDVRQAIDDFEYRMGSPPDVICLDYLGYWARSFRGDEYQRLSDAIMVLKGLAKELRIPIIAPHQVNRGVKDGEAFSSDAGRGSGVIEETADFMMAIWSADNQLGRNPEEKNGQLVMEILKSRHGGRGQKLKIQFAPLTLAMVPLEDPLASLARDELTYASSMHRDSWEDALYRHRTGFKGKMTTLSPRSEQGTL